MLFRIFLAATLVLGFASHVLAQDDSVGLDDLPDCSKPCAQTAATQVSCATTDISCLCSHDQFTSSTLSCAYSPGVCSVEDRSSTSGVMGELCSPQNTNTSTTSSAAASSASTSTSASATPTSTSAAATTTSSSSSVATSSTSTSQIETDTAHSTTSSPPTVTTAGKSNGNTAAVAGLTTPTTGSSSTLLVVQTVELPETTDVSSSASQVDGGVGLYSVLPVVFAMAGALLL